MFRMQHGLLFMQKIFLRSVKPTFDRGLRDISVCCLIFNLQSDVKNAYDFENVEFLLVFRLPKPKQVVKYNNADLKVEKQQPNYHHPVLCTFSFVLLY